MHSFYLFLLVHLRILCSVFPISYSLEPQIHKCHTASEMHALMSLAMDTQGIDALVPPFLGPVRIASWDALHRWMGQDEREKDRNWSRSGSKQNKVLGRDGPSFSERQESRRIIRVRLRSRRFDFFLLSGAWHVESREDAVSLENRLSLTWNVILWKTVIMKCILYCQAPLLKGLKNSETVC